MRTRLIVASCAAIVLLGALGLSDGLGTRAAWNSAAPMSDDALSSGTLSMTVGDGSTQSHDYKFSGLDTASLAPGDSNRAPLTVRNAGNVPMAFTLVSSTATGELAAALTLRVDSVSSTTQCERGSGFSGTPQTLLYEGSLDGVSGSPATALAPDAEAVLCFAVSLPADASGTAQNEAATATFTLRAESRSGA